MKQILQNVRTGELRVAEVPCPSVTPNTVLIQTRASVISAGTERMLVEFSKASLLQKARQKPEQVKLVLDMIRSDGLLPTLEAVFRKLDEPLPLGYCNAGVVLEAGSAVHDLAPGDRVISNGPHAEVVCVPRNLCARIPDGVSDEHAAFTVMGSIALQGIRLAQPTLGESFVVSGLGLVGLMTVQLLKAHGCRVMATDVNPKRLALVEAMGVETVDLSAGADPVAAAQSWTGGSGADGVIVAAAAKTDAIMHQAAASCRKRGRIVLVGVVGLNLQRNDFYEKELSFQVSCSYGPGRYDESYEQAGRDYPLGFVRWTEQRNFKAVLGALAAGQIAVNPFITDRVRIADAVSAYEKLKGGSDSLGIVLQYPEQADLGTRIGIPATSAKAAGTAVVGVIGAGNFANAILMPALARTTATTKYVADIKGAAAQHLAAKHGAANAVSDYRLVLDDPEVNTVVVVLQHHLHARMVCEALEAGKHVFVEKPLCITEEELERILTVRRASLSSPSPPLATGHSPLLAVGFNRRFSPHTEKILEVLAGRREPLCMNMTVNPGALAASHWTQDPERGGGRILGEGCHFIDLLAHIAGSPVTTVSATHVGGGVEIQDDKVSIALSFADGSVGTVNYFSNGAKQYPKERLEVFNQGRVLVLDNFRSLRGYGCGGFRRFKTARQDKGHREEFRRFIEAVSQGGISPTPFDQVVNITRAAFAAVRSAREQETIKI